jgi:hypothetical protein
MARDGIRLRQFGQQIIERLAGKRIHPAWVVPGGVGSPLTAENRDRILAGIPEALGIATRALDWFKNEMERFREEIRSFANFPTMFMGLVGDDGGLEHYSGKIRFLDAGGRDNITVVVAAFRFLDGVFRRRSARGHRSEHLDHDVLGLDGAGLEVHPRGLDGRLDPLGHAGSRDAAAPGQDRWDFNSNSNCYHYPNNNDQYICCWSK